MAFMPKDVTTQYLMEHVGDAFSIWCFSKLCSKVCTLTSVLTKATISYLCSTIFKIIRTHRTMEPQLKTVDLLIQKTRID